MIRNHAYLKSIHLLTHPFSLAAILILLLNDHILRQFFPSWLTGKLGDFAWLFFFPYALAALLAWVVPAHLPRRVEITGLLAFGATGTVFALTKTLPFFHKAIVQAASRAFGFPVGWVRDPSDLIALSAIAAAWLLWQRDPTQRAPSSTYSTRPAWLLLSLVALLTVANAAQPEAGIGCLRSTNEQLIACSAYTCYASTDGGLTWSASAELRPLDCPTWYYDQEPTGQTIHDASDPAIQYRTNPGISIERSTDGGQSWQVEQELGLIEEAERAYAVKSSGGNSAIFSPPLDALSDPKSGNLVFAMGFSGVLVRQPDGTYSEVAVGNFTPQRPAFGQMLFAVLSGELILALIFGALGIATISLPQKKHWLRITALGLGWLVWAMTSIIFSPAIQEGAYAYIFPQAGTLVGAVLAFLLLVEALIRTESQSKSLAVRLVLLLLGSAVLYFLPYLLWLVNILPSYSLALGFGVLLGGGLLVSNWKKARRLPG